MKKAAKPDFDIYFQYRPILLSYLYGKIDKDTSEDMVQDIFLTYYNKRETIEKPRQWLYGALRIELQKYFRKTNKNTEATSDIDDFNNDLAMTFVNAFKDTRIIIEDAVENTNMKEKERSVFEMKAFFNYDTANTADALNLSHRQVRYYFQNASNKIRHHLKKKGIEKIEDLL